MNGDPKGILQTRGLRKTFGGVHAVQRDPAGRLSGAGDPRRGGSVAGA